MFDAVFRFLFPKQLLQGKMISTHLNSQTGLEEKLIYSPYSELEFTSADEKLFVRFVNTQGLERIPNGHPFENIPKKTLRQWFNDGLIPWVGEIYFINYSDHEISVKPHMLSMIGQTREFDEDLNIAANRIAITSPLVLIHNNYGVEFDVELSFSYGGDVVSLADVAKRLTVDEVSAKYATN